MEKGEIMKGRKGVSTWKDEEGQEVGGRKGGRGKRAYKRRRRATLQERVEKEEGWRIEGWFKERK